MAMNFQAPRYQQFDSNGDPSPGAKLWFYNTGTSTPRPVYSDDGLSIAITQPVVADAAGLFAQIFISTGTYRAVCKNSAESVTFFDEDDIDPSLSTNAGALAVANGGTGSTTAAGARSNLGAASQAAFDAVEIRVDDVEATLALPILAAANTQAYAASFTPVFTSFETRSVTLTGPITINAPTVTAGQRVRLVLIQDATGSRVATWNSAWEFPGDVAAILSTTANAVDMLEGYARTTGIIEVTSFKRQNVVANKISLYTDYDKGAYALSTAYTEAHGLGHLPADVAFYLECTTIDNGWAVGDRVVPPATVGGANNATAFTFGFNATNAILATSSVLGVIIPKTGGTAATMTAARWKVILRIFD